MSVRRVSSNFGGTRKRRSSARATVSASNLSCVVTMCASGFEKSNLPAKSGISRSVRNKSVTARTSTAGMPTFSNADSKRSSRPPARATRWAGLKKPRPINGVLAAVRLGAAHASARPTGGGGFALGPHPVRHGNSRRRSRSPNESTKHMQKTQWHSPVRPAPIRRRANSESGRPRTGWSCAGCRHGQALPMSAPLTLTSPMPAIRWLLACPP